MFILNLRFHFGLKATPTPTHSMPSAAQEWALKGQTHTKNIFSSLLSDSMSLYCNSTFFFQAVLPPTSKGFFHHAQQGYLRLKDNHCFLKLKSFKPEQAKFQLRLTMGHLASFACVTTAETVNFLKSLRIKAHSMWKMWKSPDNSNSTVKLWIKIFH